MYRRLFLGAGCGAVVAAAALCKVVSGMAETAAATGCATPTGIVVLNPAVGCVVGANQGNDGAGGE